LDDKSPAALLEDDLGEYDDTRWRFSESVGNNTYVEFPEINEIVPGQGYWLLVSEPVRIIDTGPGTSNILSEEYSIIVPPGWNLIGNPFNFLIPASNIHLQDGSLVDLRTFAGAETASWNNPVTDPVPRILPFEGYAVFNNEPFNTLLFVDPDLSVTTSSMAKTVNEKDISWSIEIHAQSQQARDVDNVAGVALQSSENWDNLDFPEPNRRLLVNMCRSLSRTETGES
jgi:hypothetical protein